MRRNKIDHPQSDENSQPYREGGENHFSSPPGRGLVCTECLNPIAGEPFSFGGAFACRDCIVRYNKRFGCSDSEIADDLRGRAYEALCLLGKRRRS